jgi:RNA polymerase sigma-70 factor, ECF subfamily
MTGTKPDLAIPRSCVTRPAPSTSAVAPISRFVHNYLFARIELSATAMPLLSMQPPTQAKEPAPPDQTLLVLLAQAGDRTALEQLLRDAHAPLRRYITHLAGSGLADDILQETSLQICRKLPFLREPAVFRPWTFRIASRIAFSHLKRARRWQALDDAPPEHLTTFDPSLGEPPDERFLTLLDQVSPASRAVLCSAISTTSHWKKLPPSWRFRSAPPSRASTTESPPFANI